VAKSRHHGPTNYDGPNPRASSHSHIRRLLFGGGRGLSAKVYAFAALLLLLAGFAAGAEGFMAYRVALWALAAVVAFGQRDKRREVLGMLAGFAAIVFLLWFFLGRNF
jgi:hypothetical protein